jgi:hypothetical protein
VKVKNADERDMRVLAASASLGRLTRLELSWSEIGNAGVQALAASPHTRRLKHLLLEHTGVGISGLEALATSPHLQELTSLSLRANELDDAGVAALSASCRLSRLSHLELANNRVGPDGIQGLASSPLGEQLTVVGLWSNQLRDEGVRRLACLPQLGEVNLGGNHITAAGARALASSPHLQTLVKLDLGHNPIGDTGTAALAGSSRLGRLAELNLVSCSVGVPGTQAGARSATFARLARLCLSGNKIGDVGLGSLAWSPYLPGLVRLEVASCGIRKAGAEALLSSDLVGRLRALNIKRNDISREAFQGLRARLGDEVEHEYRDDGYSLGWAVSHVKAHPPRCIRGFAVRTDTDVTRKVLAAAVQSSPAYVAFELGHRDSSQRPVLLGYFLEPPSDPAGENLFVSPLGIRWEPSGEVVEVLDCERHGYDGEQDGNCCITGSGPRSPWQCPYGCREHVFVACFSYHDESPIRVPDAYLPLQDQFDWFVLAAYCRDRDAVVPITDFECS